MYSKVMLIQFFIKYYYIFKFKFGNMYHLDFTNHLLHIVIYLSGKYSI